jgi:hypothetical protein
MEWLIGIYLGIGLLVTMKRLSASPANRPAWMNLERNPMKFAALFTLHTVLWPIARG